MPNKGKFIGSQDNLFVPDAPTIGATSGATDGEVSVAFTAPSDVGNDAITLYGASVFLAGATINYKVSVGTGTLSTGGSGNVYFIDGIPTKTLSLIKGFTYVFDLSDGSNSGHPFGFKNASDGAYTTGVTTSGTAGSASATVTLVLATDASEPSRYYCTSHGNGMGNTISLIEASASTDPLGAAQAGATGSSSPITVTGLSNGTSYIAQVWAINDYGNGPLSAATSSFTPIATTVGLIKGGYAASAPTNTVQKIVPEVAGDATDFGDLSGSNYSFGSLSSDTRSIVAGGYYNNAAYTNIIEYFTFASAGNATDFGDGTTTMYNSTGISNNVRGVFAIGLAGGSNVNTLEYITIPSTGNSIDFGDATETKQVASSVGSSTRGVFAGNNSFSNVIEYITLASTGNGTDFGDLTTSRGFMDGGASSSTRGVFGPGLGGGGSTYYNTLDYITIASTGNATDFGDAVDSTYGTTGMSNSTKGIFSGGQNSSSRVNVIQQITIASTGNATDFGDLLSITSYLTSTCSGNPAVQNETGFAPAAIGLFAGGGDGSGSFNGQTTIMYVNIATDGESGMFGDLTEKVASANIGTAASSTRGIIRQGGNNGAYTNTLEYITFSTKSKATDFGDMTVSNSRGATLSNSTRGIFAGGQSDKTTMGYVTIASAGDALDFGDLSVARYYNSGVAGTTRGISAGGDTGSSKTNVIDYVTIASTGNAQDFGDLTESPIKKGAVSSNTRAVFGGGDLGSNTNVMDYITIASTGNATDFGDTTTTARHTSAAVSSSTLGLFHNLSTSSYNINIDKITIASTGNATDWGDLDNHYQKFQSANAHGGIA